MDYIFSLFLFRNKKEQAETKQRKKTNKEKRKKQRKKERFGAL